MNRERLFGFLRLGILLLLLCWLFDWDDGRIEELIRARVITLERYYTQCVDILKDIGLVEGP